MSKMDKNIQLLFVGAGLSLCSAGLIWMVSTLITVDKRTEVMHVKIDHLVQGIQKITERQAKFDQSWTDELPSIQASAGEK